MIKILIPRSRRERESNSQKEYFTRDFQIQDLSFLLLMTSFKVVRFLFEWFYPSVYFRTFMLLVSLFKALVKLLVQWFKPKGNQSRSIESKTHSVIVIILVLSLGIDVIDDSTRFVFYQNSRKPFYVLCCFWFENIQKVRYMFLQFPCFQ